MFEISLPTLNHVYVPIVPLLDVIIHVNRTSVSRNHSSYFPCLCHLQLVHLIELVGQGFG